MKIGRNEPCPCGSGKKYKKCCLPKEVVTRTPEEHKTPSSKVALAALSTMVLNATPPEDHS
jgi:hypothetical protein